MRITRLCLCNFRNIASAEIVPGDSITVLHGLNGQGKTNLLEAIHMLGHARPFRPAKTADLVMHGEAASFIRGEIRNSSSFSEILIHLEGGNRRVKVDGKPVHRSTELHGRLGVVLFSPEDTAMVRLGPETRRRYLDRAIYGSEVTFLKDYHDYYRILKQRNHLLKSGNREGLEEWTEQLAEAGARLMASRRGFARRLDRIFGAHYLNIAGAEEKVALLYRPDSGESEDDAARLKELLDAGLQSDIRHGATGRGPHRDDLQFMINGRPLRTFGSQGQQRTFVLALKMAELDSIQDTFGEPPVLLLDDMSSELDRNRSANLLEFVRQRGIQSFITTTDRNALPSGMVEMSLFYRVEDGKLTYEGTA